MRVVKHTQISLSKAECFAILAEHLRSNGYNVKPGDVEAYFNYKSQYDTPSFDGVVVKCQYEEDTK